LAAGLFCEGPTSGTGEKTENPGDFVHSRSSSTVPLSGFLVYANCPCILFAVFLIFIMDKVKKIINQILSGRSDANIAFKDLCNLLTVLGFDLRIRGRTI
jgi:hypothetical protein